MINWPFCAQCTPSVTVKVSECDTCHDETQSTDYRLCDTCASVFDRCMRCGKNISPPASQQQTVTT